MGTNRTDEFRKYGIRIALRSAEQRMILGINFPSDGLSRKQIADDLGVAMSPLNKWITAHRDTEVVPPKDRELALENERLRRENRILRADRDILNRAGSQNSPGNCFADEGHSVRREPKAVRFRYVQDHTGSCERVAVRGDERQFPPVAGLPPPPCEPLAAHR